MINDNLIQTVIDTVENAGVQIVGMDIVKDEAEFFLLIDPEKMVEKTVEDTLINVYGLLWTAVYGKVNDFNRNKKITLHYEVKGEEK